MVIRIWLVAVSWCLAGSAFANQPRRKAGPPPPLWGGRFELLTQPVQRVQVAKQFCGSLKRPEAPLNKRELKQPSIPGWEPLRWGLSVDKVRWGLRSQRIPIDLHCFAKTASPYLKLKRALQAATPGITGAWDGTVYFGQGKLYNILMQSPVLASEDAVKAALGKLFRRFGPATPKAGYSNAKSFETRYIWRVGTTDVKVNISRSTPKKTATIFVSYSPAPPPKKH